MQVEFIRTVDDVITGALVTDPLPCTRPGPDRLALALVIEARDTHYLELHATVFGQVYQSRKVLTPDHQLNEEHALVEAGREYLEQVIAATPRQPWWRRAWYRFQLSVPPHTHYQVQRNNGDTLLTLGQKEGRWGLFLWTEGLSIFVPKPNVEHAVEVWTTPDLLALQVAVSVTEAQNARIREMMDLLIGQFAQSLALPASAQRLSTKSSI